MHSYIFLLKQEVSLIFQVLYATKIGKGKIEVKNLSLRFVLTGVKK
jgi:hypothetical protein